MFLALLLILLQGQPAAIIAELGMPLTIEYPIPPGWETEPIEEPGVFWNLLGQDEGRITLIPLCLDTLPLPVIIAYRDTLVMEVQPPAVIVSRTMPDSTYALKPFPAPLTVDIPAGFAGDHLHMHKFWLEWGPPPGPRWILPVSLLSAAVLIITMILLYIRRRRNRDAASRDDISALKSGISPEEEAMALLNIPAFAEGDWLDYYREVDRLLRATVSVRFNISNPALTWHQLQRRMAAEKGGSEFSETSDDLTREITLQRYANWGGSRERARKYTLMLASIRREWHR